VQSVLPEVDTRNVEFICYQFALVCCPLIRVCVIFFSFLLNTIQYNTKFAKRYVAVASEAQYDFRVLKLPLSHK